jgi:hypothetical protein
MDLWAVYPSGQLTSTKARTFVKWFETTITRDASDEPTNRELPNESDMI